MKTIFDTAMRKATKLTQSQQGIEATRVIQRALSGGNRAPSMEQQPAGNLRRIEPGAAAHHAESEQAIAGNARPGWRKLLPTRGLSRAAGPLVELLTLLRRGNRPGLAPSAKPPKKAP